MEMGDYDKAGRVYVGRMLDLGGNLASYNRWCPHSPTLPCAFDPSGDADAQHGHPPAPSAMRADAFFSRGHQGNRRHKQRWKEVDDGKVPMPRLPRLLYVLTGKGFDPSTGTVAGSYVRWVVYTPYATPESTGLSTKSGADPWLMYPGTAGAHIMISPPRK